MHAPRRTLTGTLCVLVAATAMLSACDEQSQPRAAAIVDGSTILESDVQTATREFNTGSSQATQPMRPGSVVTALTYGHYVLPAMEKAGKGVSDADAAQYLDKIDDPSPATLAFVKSVLAVNSMDDQVRSQVSEELHRADIRINPRYGTFDRDKLAVGPETRNWLAVDEATRPTP